MIQLINVIFSNVILYFPHICRCVFISESQYFRELIAILNWKLDILKKLEISYFKNPDISLWAIVFKRHYFYSDFILCFWYLILDHLNSFYGQISSLVFRLCFSWPTIFTRPVILHFCTENSRLKVKRHCNGLKTAKWVDKETALSNNH